VDGSTAADPGCKEAADLRFFCRWRRPEWLSLLHLRVWVPEHNPLYRFTLFTRHPRGEDFWNKILKIDEKGQRGFAIVKVGLHLSYRL